MCDTAVCTHECEQCETCSDCPKMNGNGSGKYKVSGFFVLETEAVDPKEAKEKAQAILKADGIRCFFVEAEEEAVE